MFSVPVGSWYANLGYSDNRNEGRYVSRRELPNTDDRRDNGLPRESVYMTRTRSQAWQAGLSNSFSTRGLNINSSINLFMRNDHSGDGKDKGGFLSVSLSLAHNRQGDASSYTSVGPRGNSRSMKRISSTITSRTTGTPMRAVKTNMVSTLPVLIATR